MIQPYMTVVYGLIGIWTIFSIFQIIRLLVRKDISKTDLYLYDSIPTIFTTLGVLGTFIGIYFGLQNFDVNNITASIPTLLEGLKTAFLTSILGITLSLIFGRLSQSVLNHVEHSSKAKPSTELSNLKRIAKLIEEGNNQSKDNFNELVNSITGDSDESLATQFSKLRNNITELQDIENSQTKIFNQMQKSLGGDGETSLLTQIQKLRDEQNTYSKETRKNIEWIVETMGENSELISEKFDEFAELLAKNNTEALVEVMKAATEEFNKQMSELVNKLVQENFQELNNSVQKLNDWQKENKEMIDSLTKQFVKVSEEFQITAEAIKEITENSKKLTDDNSVLKRLVAELQEVMIDDKKFKQIVDKVNDTVTILKTNTEAFDETTNKLNTWVNKQRDFSDAVAKLLTRLEEIDRIKDINEVFWDNTKKQLNEGVTIIENASNRLSNDLENINQEFYERLNDTFQSLDRLIQRIILNYDGQEL